MSTNAVRMEIYRSFIEDGVAPAPSDVATQLGMPLAGVEAAFRLLDDEGVIALVPHTTLVWLAHPFCAEKAPFRVTSDGRAWDAICIWDALGVLAVLDADGVVTTPCPDCREELRVQVRSGALESAEGHVVHYGVPASRWYEDIGYT